MTNRTDPYPAWWVHRWPRGTERTRSAKPRGHRTRREVADEGCPADSAAVGCPADSGDGRNTRFHEGSSRWEQRPHSPLHDDRLRGRRGLGRGTNGDAGKPAILETPRRHSRSPDDSRRTRSAPFECAAWVRKIGHQKNWVVAACRLMSSRYN